MPRKTCYCVLLVFAVLSHLAADDMSDDKKSKIRFVTEPEIDLEAEYIKLKAEFEAFKNQSKGSTFTRWGKNDCPSLTDFVYRGFIAGKKYNDQGGTSDTLCLPTDPTWGKYTDTPEAWRAHVYGTELDIDMTSGDHIFDKHVYNEDMPCVFCRSPFPTTAVIPARVNCYPGWTLQYSGYLVTNSMTSGRESYDSICLDKDPDFLPHSEANSDQHVVYLMEAKCGSLPCPPYANNRELACAVCSM